MPDAIPRQHLETPRARLVGLSEALFDKAPFSRRANNGFRGSGTELLTLCRGLGSVDLVLRRFELSWYRMRLETCHVLRDEWDERLERLSRDAREHCNACLFAPGTGFGPAAAYDCSVCGIRVAYFAEELEGCARRLTETLNVLAPMSALPMPAPASEPAPAPAPEPVAAPAPAPAPAPPEAPVPAPEIIDAPDTRIAELEAKLREYNEILDQTQTALELANNESKAQGEASKALTEELDNVRKVKDELQTVNVLLEEDLKETIESIEKYAEDLDELMRWQTAQLAYAQLHQLVQKQLGRILVTPETERRRKELEIKSMGFRHKQSVTLMRLGRHQEAEAMCGEIWEKRGELEAGTSKAVARRLLKDYCDMLVRNGKYEIAEQQYQLVLWNELYATTDREDEKERFLIWSRLGDIKTEQKKYVDAARLHREALEKIMQLQPLEVDLAAESAMKCIAAQRMQDDSYAIVDNSIGKHFETIWLARRRNSEKPAVLTCGHEHGVRLLNDGKDEDAATVLSTVWERRKSLGEGHREAAMETALCLVDLSVRTENLVRLETLYHWITQNPTSDQSEADRLWARYRLGCVQAVLNKHVVAETNLRKALNRQRDLFGADDPDTLQYTQVLTEVLRRDRRNGDALAMVRGIWERRQRIPRSVLHAVLRIGHVYGDILSESNGSKDLLLAEGILKEVWQTTSSNLAMMKASSLSLEQLSGLVPSGDCYALVLMKRNYFTTAKEVLTPVLEWKRWEPLNCDPASVARTTYLLNKATDLEQKESEAKKVKYQPSTPHVHPLRLADFLDRWFSDSIVTGFIENT